MTVIPGFLFFLLGQGLAVDFPNDLTSTTDDSLELLTTTDTSVPDNGMALGEISDQVTNGNAVRDFEVTINGNKLTEYPPYGIPQNHKNYSSPFVNAIELPPLLNQFNAYQQQYKDYYKQKSEFGYKPIKFEANNQYVPEGLSAYLQEDERHKYEELKYDKHPYAFTYENEKLPLLEQSSWSAYEDGHPVQNDITTHYYQTYEVKPEGGVASKEKGLHGWKKALKFFTALVPLGLLLATLTPTVISINSTTDQKPIRQRSLNDANLTGEDFREFLQREYGTNRSECDKKLICELSLRGREDTSTYVQKSFWYLANKIPDEVAKELGTRELFRAIRSGNCDTYKCPKMKMSEEKKMTKRKRKKVAEARPSTNTSHYGENPDLYNT